MLKKDKNDGFLVEALGRIPGQTVLVVGDLMLDRYVRGDVHRISPESPVPVLAVTGTAAVPGGAGNVLANLAGLGVKASLVAVTGDDEEGSELRNLLENSGINISGLIAVAGRPTAVKTRFMAGHHHLLRADREDTQALSTAVEKEIIARVAAAVPLAKVMVLSDYGKGVLSENVIAALIREAQKHGVPVLVDPKKKDFAVYRGATVITPNRKELQEAAGLPAGSDEEVVRAAMALIGKTGIETVIATRAQDGISIVRKNKEPVHLRAAAREVFDVSGAGDTVIAVVAAALAAGADIETAAALANRAAGLVVAKAGTAAVQVAELRTALQGDNGKRSRIAPLCGEDEAAVMVDAWRAQGLRVGFTNGCFDILHAGHVSYLDEAHSQCDRLIVALNADDSVRRLKGPERPVNNENARGAVLGALSSVDMVVLFGAAREEEDKPLKLIARLKPDIYFKGGDYREADLPETPLVRGYGGIVAIMALHEGHSTTGMIGKLKKGRAA